VAASRTVAAAASKRLPQRPAMANAVAMIVTCAASMPSVNATIAAASDQPRGRGL